MDLGKMGMKFARIGMLVVAVALLSLGGVALAQEYVDVQLDPVNDSGVSGTARVTAAGEGSEVTLNVSGLEANAEAQASLHSGTCDMPSASFAALPNLTADADGRASGSGTILFQGSENVALASIADGEHVIIVQSGGQNVACGVIPVGASVQQPSQLPETGGTGFPLAAVILGVAGLGALAGGLFLGQRQSSSRNS